MANEFEIRDRTRHVRARDFDKADRVGDLIIAAKSFEVFDLFKLAFGTIPFESVNIPEQDSISKSGAPLIEATKFGTYHFCPVQLKENESDAGFTLQNSFISIQGRKRIVETELIGQDGNVKEEIGMDDYEITIRGVIINKEERFPEKDMENFVKWWKLRKSLIMVNAVADLFLDPADKIVIYDINWPDMRGIDYAQAYEFRAKSDKPFNLIIE